MANRMLPYPFLKWAGGKGRMIGHVLPLMPEKINTYYEPFIGGGAVFFELVRQGKFKKAVVGDLNSELINTYLIVKNQPDELVSELNNGSYKYDKKNYLRIRAIKTVTLSDVERAARVVFLNRTCFNGLYRINKEGQFNTSFGLYKDPVICDEPNLRAISKALENVTILLRDFESVVKKAKSGDVVYFDPPYLPISDTSNFTAYNTGGFSLEDHKRLAACFTRLTNSGVRCILSNSYCPTTLDLYKGYSIDEHMGARVIGGPASYRKPVREIIISNQR